MKKEIRDKVIARMKAKRIAQRHSIIAKPLVSADTLLEKKYTVKEAAVVLGCSARNVLRRFKQESGIVYVGNDPNSQRRRFVIPESVLTRVYRQHVKC